MLPDSSGCLSSPGRPRMDAWAALAASVFLGLLSGCIPNVRTVVVAINPKVYVSDVADPNAPRAAVDRASEGPTIEELEASLKSYDSRAER